MRQPATTSDRPNLDALDRVRSGPFRYRFAGEVHSTPSPVDLSVDDVLAILFDQHVPDTPRMRAWQRDLVFQRWQAHHDLPPYQRLQRLTVLVERYRYDIEVDLQQIHGLSLNAMWQARDWRRLLNFIDRFPSNTWYHEAVVNDPDHVRQLVEAEERNKDQATEEAEAPAPPMHTWSAELAQITEVLDATKRVAWTIAAVNSEKGKTPEAPKPAPRPKSPLEAERRRAAQRRRLQKHKKLAARMLPHKYDSEGNPLG